MRWATTILRNDESWPRLSWRCVASMAAVPCSSEVTTMPLITPPDRWR